MTIRCGVRWTPSAAAHLTVARTDDVGSAELLARQLRGSQRLLGHKVDAVVVYRLPGGGWTTSRFVARVRQLLAQARRRPLRFPVGADEKVQQLLDDMTP